MDEPYAEYKNLMGMVSQLFTAAGAPEPAWAKKRVRRKVRAVF